MTGDIIDLYPGEAGSFTVPPDDAVLPFEPPFVSPPPTLTELIEAVGEALRSAIIAVADAVDELFAIKKGTDAPMPVPVPVPFTFSENAPANRAQRRRKHAQPERPGWMAAFPPPDPARTARRR